MRRTKLKNILADDYTPKRPEKNHVLLKTIKECGYTQKLVAYMAEIDYQRLNHIINGWAKPQFIEKQVLAKILNRSVKELF